MEKTTITVDEYARLYVPLGPWLVVKKIKPPIKTASGIYLSEKHVNENAKFSMLGRVLAKSDFKVFESDLERYYYDKIHVGDWVGFSATVPVISPAPPNITFEADDSEGRDIVTLHAGDVLGIYAKDDKDSVTVRARFVDYEDPELVRKQQDYIRAEVQRHFGHYLDRIKRSEMGKKWWQKVLRLG